MLSSKDAIFFNFLNAQYVFICVNVNTNLTVEIHVHIDVFKWQYNKHIDEDIAICVYLTVCRCLVAEL